MSFNQNGSPGNVVILFLYAFLLVPAFSFGRLHVVSSGVDSVPNSLRHAIDSVVSTKDTIRDTVVFNVAASDTVVVQSEIVIHDSYITVEGRNVHSGNRVVVQVEKPGVSPYRVFTLYGGDTAVKIRNMVLRGGDVSGNLNDAYGGTLNCGGGIRLDSMLITDGRAVQGGGIYTSTGFNLKNSTVTANIGQNEKFLNDVLGGGIFLEAGAMYLENCSITENRCITRSNHVAACGGGIYTYDDKVVLVNCTIAGNSVETSGDRDASGGGVYTYQGTLEIVNSTIVNNYCRLNSDLPAEPTIYCVSRGGGIYASSSACFVVNSIILNNDIGNNKWQISADYWTSKATEPTMIHSLIGSADYPLYSICQNCSTAYTAHEVFGTDTPKLIDHYPLPKTFCRSASSIAAGSGVPAATFPKGFPDIIVNTLTVPDAAYFDGEKWIELATGAAVPSGIPLTLITKDQLGIDRPLPPGIGATECVIAYEESIGKPPIRKIVNKAAVIGRNVYMDFEGNLSCIIQLSDLLGRAVFTCNFYTSVGRNHVLLPNVPGGAYILRILFNSEQKILKVMM